MVILQSIIKCIYVDNCCHVRGKLQKIFKGVLVKCDLFHWEERCEVILYDSKSEKAIVFRTLMLQAIFVIEPHEFERTKQLLISKGKTPTNRDILKAAKATIPPPDILERRIMSTLHTLMQKDHEVDRARTTGNTPGNPPAAAAVSRFFKRGAETLNTIVRQMEHVKKGCLSDPDASVVKIHRYNPKTKKTYSARSTGSNEVDNRCVLNSMETPTISITKADIKFNNYYEGSNDRKRVNRLGEDPQLHRSEQIQMLHGMAQQCGYSDSDVPYGHKSYPKELMGLDERIGFDYHLPEGFSNEKETSEDSNVEEQGHEEMRSFLAAIDFLEADLHLDASQFARSEGDSDDDCDSDYIPIDVFAMDDKTADVDVSIYLPLIADHESTYQTYLARTQEAPWVPLAHPKDAANFTDLDKAEHELFDTLSPTYDRQLKKLDAPKGYKTFAKVWDLHVANRLKESLQGEEDVLLINRLSHTQLQDHCDNKEKHEQLMSNWKHCEDQQKEIIFYLFPEH